MDIANGIPKTGNGSRVDTDRRLRILVVEDSVDDYDILVMTLAAAGHNVAATRVEDEAAMRAALESGEWDVVISDHRLPRFSARAALATLQSAGRDIPFIIVSGAIGEDAAVEAMLAGADDFVRKDALARLVPAIERSMKAANTRAQQHAAQEALRESETRLRALSAHLQKIKEDERARIAREIHDDIGGTLTGLKADLVWLKKRFGTDPLVGEKLASMDTLLGSAVEASVRIARDLRPPILDHGFVDALEWQARDFQKRTGIRCRFTASDEDLELEPNAAVAAFRIVQELLTNITKHARAKEVTIALAMTPVTVQLEVIDDGVGIAPKDRGKRDSFGLRGMIERAREFDGELVIAAGSGGGTRAVLTLPRCTLRKDS